MAVTRLGAFTAVWTALLAGSVALSLLAAQHETLPGDTWIMSWAQDRAYPGEALSDIVRAFTTTEAVLATGVLVVVALWLLGYRWEAGVLAVGLAVLPLLQAGLKEIVDRPRPMEPLVTLRTGFSSESFPAGHVMSPALLYGFLLYLTVSTPLPRVVRWLTGIWSVAVIVVAGPPNVWLGVHWPSDVLGGWAWGLVLVGALAIVIEGVRARYT